MTLRSHPRKQVTVRIRGASPLVRGVCGGLLLAGVLLTGCGGDKSGEGKKSPAADGKTADVKKTVAETPVAAPTPAGRVKTKGAPSASAMPDDVPIYPGATQTNATQVGSQSVAGYKTPDPHASVISFYSEKLPASGWKIDKQDGAALGATIRASKERRTLTVAITRALPQGAVVNLSHRP